MKVRCIRQITLFSIVVLFLSGAQACKKDNPTPLEQLPPETQEGNDTFGCLVNGRAWKRGCDCYLFGPSTLDANYEKGRLVISAKKIEDNIKEYVDITVNSGVNAAGTYRLVSNPESYGSFEIRNGCYYETDSLNTGLLEITRLDTLERIVSGRFSFTATKPGCERVNITDGRFDIRY